MSEFEFQHSLAILSKRMGLGDIADLVLIGETGRTRQRMHRAASGDAGAGLTNATEFTDLDLNDMQALLKVGHVHFSVGWATSFVGGCVIQQGMQRNPLTFMHTDFSRAII